MKKVILAFLTGTLACMCLTVYSDALQEDVAQSVLRLHILANSDSDADQSLKLSVRDKILEESRDLFTACSSREESIRIFEENKERIASIAQNEIFSHGYTYPVSVSLEKTYFPMKSYDGITLPAGEYDAVRVTIGQAKGQNWWCVMFPPLCFVDGSISEDSTAKLQERLGDDAAVLTPTSSQDVKIRFKIVDFMQNATHVIKEALRRA